ncbi:hypothetical protein OX284_011430 [Flavobacterium sp. SUN046]|uniref:hypothetical protein n=1 Tax=Flavobacterium sp. SUN046 TaxID=3002440 RepID=UPI002DBF9384|nr:hypothetical protein [Flavobacterium sp. SUN046]MEC4050043.1 hypothetical protein [Flavobacterium sp. SUN046]
MNNPILRGILAVLAGIFIGGMVNMALIMISSSVIPPPVGANLKTMKGLQAAMHLMEPKHFLMPFLAHALGTLVGAFVAASIVAQSKMRYALGISAWFLMGGIMSVCMLPSPLWFTLVDLIGAYLPFGYVGYLLSSNFIAKEK